MKPKVFSKHVLLVDDDDFFREALNKVLLQAGYEVSAVRHAQLAQDLFGIESIDIVVSDINMPGISGLELLKFVQESKSEVPVILMTGFAELKETVEAFDLGAKGFLAKPFKKEDLLTSIDNLLFPQKAAKEAEGGEELNYCKLSIDDFISGHKIKFDIYVRLSQDKYVKIAHQGEDIPVERIDAYKSKNIRFLYMKKEDFRKYMGFNISLMPLVMAKSSIAKEKKRSFVRHTNEVILEYLHLNGVDEEGFQSAKVVVDSTVQMLTEADEMMSLLALLNSHADHLYAHSLGVSMYGVMIAKKVEWNLATNLYKVAMGGLLHDIGKSGISRDILLKPRWERSVEENRLYEAHPSRGVEILSRVPSIPSDVLEIVMQHHEDCQGQGFPMNLPRSRIHPMARLISVANEFCSIVVKGPDSLNLSPAAAIHRMTTLSGPKFDPVFLTALREVFRG